MVKLRIGWQSFLRAASVPVQNRILERDHEAYVAAEREVLTAVVHPYIVTLQYSFQTSSKLYLLLDFINGGHLFFQLYREVIPLACLPRPAAEVKAGNQSGQ